MTVYDVLSTMKSRPRSHDSPEGLGAQGSRSFAIIRKKGVSVSVHVHCVCVCTPLCACVHTSVCVCVYWKSQGTEPICCLEKETVCKTNQSELWSVIPLVHEGKFLKPQRT